MESLVGVIKDYPTMMSREPQEVRKVWLLGFAGHRSLADPSGAKSALLAEIRRLNAELSGELIGISSAAAGSDLLFLETCHELGLKTIVLLPFSQARFKEDFEDPAEWDRARKLIESAWWSEIVPGNEEAPGAYHRVSRELLEMADLMFFLWDGKPSGGPGGTGETVEEAGVWKIPSTIIDAITYQVRFQPAAREAPSPDNSFDDLPPVASVRKLFEALDARANFGAPRSRWFHAGSMSVNTVAVILQAGLLAVGVAAKVGAFAKFLLSLVAVLLPKVGARLRLREQWIADRTRAELLRSLLSTNGLTSPLRPPAVELFDKQSDLLRSASLMLVGERRNWETARDAYVAERLDGQIAYLREKGELAERRMRVYNVVFNLCSWGAVVTSVVVGLGIVVELGGNELSKRWLLGFLPAVLPGLAAWSLAMMSVFEFRRRSELYLQMVEELERLRPKVGTARCASAAAAAVRQCERLLLNELWEWQAPRKK